MNNHSHTMRAVAKRAVVLAATMLLASCGGGGSDADPDASNPAGPGAPGAPATPTSTGSTCGLSDFAATALTRINQLRAAGANCKTKGVFAPAPPLTWNALLTQSSEVQSQDMVAKNFFSHTGSNGSTLSDRVNATGYGWSSLGENIAAGYPTIDAVMTGWLDSDGHCANLMNRSFKEVGLVCVPGSAANTYNTYWTMDLGSP